MRILVAPDKFKGSLGAADVAQKIALGLRDILSDAEINLQPVADGGEGTAEIICSVTGGEWFSYAVHDAVGRRADARYCIIPRNVAVIDASAACGLSQVPPDQRDPDNAISFGVGELMQDAARRGASEIIIGLGGTATNDGGFGLARALGYRFLARDGRELRGAVSALAGLKQIEAPRRQDWPQVTAAADVQNPLLGARGATRTFAMQKGARAEQLDGLELALERLADIVARDLGSDTRSAAGAGAAGGLGFGLLSFCGATIARGFDVVAQFIGLEEAIKSHDVIITGEGRFDLTTLEGKAPAGVAQLARKNRKQVFAIVGQMDTATDLGTLFDHVFPLAYSFVAPEEARRDVRKLLRERGRELARQL